jgi:hypothetical protein
MRHRVREVAAVRATAREGSSLMSEEFEDGVEPLTRDAPCVRCGHAAHPYLACGTGCDCQPTLMPGDERLSRT